MLSRFCSGVHSIFTVRICVLCFAPVCYSFRFVYYFARYIRKKGEIKTCTQIRRVWVEGVGEFRGVMCYVSKLRMKL